MLKARTMSYFHLTCQALHGLAPLRDRDACADLWARLRARFQAVYATVFMPNHLHLAMEADDPEAARIELGRVVAAFAQSRGRRLWNPVAPVAPIADRAKLRRHIRYILLNPCRARLATDPLEWEWSTHRDVVGAAADSWVDRGEMARLWDCSSLRLPERFHAYVSGDPSVKVAGTSLPARVAPERIAASLEQIGRAVMQAGRLSEEDFFRRGSAARGLAARLAYQLGGRNQEELARWLRLRERRVRGLLAAAPVAHEREVVGAVHWIMANPARFRVE